MLDDLSRQDPCYFFFFLSTVCVGRAITFLALACVTFAQRCWLDGLMAWHLLGESSIRTLFLADPRAMMPGGWGYAELTSFPVIALSCRRRDHSLSQVYCAWLLVIS